MCFKRLRGAPAENLMTGIRWARKVRPRLFPVFDGAPGLPAGSVETQNATLQKRAVSQPRSAHRAMGRCNTDDHDDKGQTRSGGFDLNYCAQSEKCDEAQNKPIEGCWCDRSRNSSQCSRHRSPPLGTLAASQLFTAIRGARHKSISARPIGNRSGDLNQSAVPPQSAESYHGGKMKRPLG
jgi:hypothetical protein